MWNQGKIIWYIKSKHYYSVEWIISVPRKGRRHLHASKRNKRNIYSLALIYTGNLVHSAIVSWDIWESIGGKINSPMDHWVGNTNGQSEGLVVGVGAPWPVHLEGVEECYILEPLVIRVRLVDEGCHSFLSKKSGTVLQATKEQTISTQVWKIPLGRIIINMLQERLEEAVGVYAKTILFPRGWGNISLCRRVVR